ncbi:hypothetical protein FBU30_001480 [Linnemannia zychae]|nr:hypothetical protein FBU30_001480 [Linnemannia zychae]
MDHLSRLPTECLQHIINFIATENDKYNSSTLAALVCANRHLANITLQYLYRDPFQVINLDSGSGSRTRKLIRTLIASWPVASLHPAIALAFELDIPGACIKPNPFRPLDYIQYISLTPNSLVQSMQETEFRYLSYEYYKLDYIQQRKDRLPTSYINSILYKNNVSRLCLQAVVYQELLWILSYPILEQLVVLYIPISDIHRYYKVIDRLSLLEEVTFITDDVYDDSPTRFSAGPCKADATRDIIMFVEEHTRRFKNQLKSAHGYLYGVFPETYNYINAEIQSQLYALLPPLQLPTKITKSNVDQLIARLFEVDISRVQSITGIFSKQWQNCIHTDPKMLQRCYSLNELDIPSLGKGTFSWAVEEKKRLMASKYEPRSEFGVVNNLLLLSDSLIFTKQQRLPPLQRIRLSEYGPSSDEIDDIVVAFSETLQQITIKVSNRYGQRPTVFIGKGWVYLPRLTHITLTARLDNIVIDPKLFTHCPNIIYVEMKDYFNHYPSADIEACLPANLPNLSSMELHGWPALTFHPETLRTTAKVHKLKLCELNHYYTAEDTLQADAMKSQIALAQNPGSRRLHWSWDWELPILSILNLEGEFAARFQFQMLVGCPNLTRLVLDIRTHDEQYVRVLSPDDFIYIPNTHSPNRLYQNGRQCESRPIVARNLTELRLVGKWEVDDTLLPSLLHGMFPRLCNLCMMDTKGFTPHTLIDLIRNKVKHVILLKTGLEPISDDEGEELGIYRRYGRKKDLKIVFPYKLYMQRAEYIVARNPSDLVLLVD